MDTDTTLKPAVQNAPNIVDKAADNASGAIRSTQNVTNAAFDRLDEKVDSVRDQAAPILDRISKKAEAVTRRGIDAVRDGSAQLREKAVQLSDTTVGHIRDEPLKAVLIAAATGAALMALVVLASRSSNGD
jgi:ElaB/YqjD/DUF883 family membrane-anchored ribosome-binding protein